MLQPNAAPRIGMSANRRPILLRSLNRFDQCSTKGSEENFEQKAAKETKETKAHLGLGFRDGYSVGPSQPNAAPRIGMSANRRPILLRRLNRLDQCSTKGSEENLNRRQQRKQRRIEDWVSAMVIR
jgi:hypothetical protein